MDNITKQQESLVRICFLQFFDQSFIASRTVQQLSLIPCSYKKWNCNLQKWIQRRKEKLENYIKFKHLRIIIRNLNASIKNILTNDRFGEHSVICYEIHPKHNISVDEYYLIIMERVIKKELVIVRDTINENVSCLRLCLIKKTSIDQFESGTYIPDNPEFYQNIIDKRKQT